MKGYVDFEYVDKATGEKFFVELNSIDYLTGREMCQAAMRVAKENFDDPKFIRVVPAEEANPLGYDTY